MEIWVNRTGGNDSNLGTVGSPLLTIPEAVRRAAAVDNNGNAITIKVKAGTYPETVGLISFLGSGTITIIGVDTTWPTAPSASITGGISASHLVGSYVIDNLNLTGGTSRNNIFLVNSTLTYQNIEFGTSANNIVSFFGSIAIGTGPTSIIQSTGSHWQCAKRGMVEDDGNRITIPNVIEVKIFAFSLESSTVICGADTFITTYSGAGSAPTMTGSSKRFQVIDAQSNISTQGSDPLTYLPGNVPGTAPAGSYF